MKNKAVIKNGEAATTENAILTRSDINVVTLPPEPTANISLVTLHDSIEILNVDFVMADPVDKSISFSVSKIADIRRINDMIKRFKHLDKIIVTYKEGGESFSETLANVDIEHNDSMLNGTPRGKKITKDYYAKGQVLFNE